MTQLHQFSFQVWRGSVELHQISCGSVCDLPPPRTLLELLYLPIRLSATLVEYDHKQLVHPVFSIILCVAQLLRFVEEFFLYLIQLLVSFTSVIPSLRTSTLLVSTDNSESVHSLSVRSLFFTFLSSWRNSITVPWSFVTDLRLAHLRRFFPERSHFSADICLDLSVPHCNMIHSLMIFFRSSARTGTSELHSTRSSDLSVPSKSLLFLS